MLAMTALPTWHQRAVPLPDGNFDPQQYNDCGETCVSMLVASTHGTPIEPGAVRQAIGGFDRSGLTTAADLVAMAAYYNVATVARALPAADAYAALLTAAGSQRTSILLGVWPSVNAPHWVIVRDASPSGIVVSDPWLGTAIGYTKATFLDLYLGWSVEAVGHLHYVMTTHPDPA